VNIPWSVQGAGDADYIYAFQKVVMPIAYEFNPQLVIGTPAFVLLIQFLQGLMLQQGIP
jgi:histone deacetylase 6